MLGGRKARQLPVRDGSPHAFGDTRSVRSSGGGAGKGRNKENNLFAVVFDIPRRIGCQERRCSCGINRPLRPMVLGGQAVAAERQIVALQAIRKVREFV